jgi:NAD(P)-dependent dehydrogenase (short-subunit alcohol dehydrogenase family)
MSDRRSFVTGLAAAATAAGLAGAAQAQTRPAAAGRFAGKVVLITGATAGIGRLAAEEFAKKGARVFFGARREALGREIEGAIRRAGGDATFMRVDVREVSQIEAFVRGAVARYGRLDVAFNNAGIGQAFGVTTDDTPAEYDDIFATNTRRKYFAMVHEAAQMERQGGGVIVNTSSIVGLRGLAGDGAYAASKWAVTGMTKSAAMELAPKGVRVVGVAPGAITDTDFMVPLMGRRLNAEEERGFAALHAMNRTGRAIEVVKAVMWLASEEASFVTGEVMKVDGYFLRG